MSHHRFRHNNKYLIRVLSTTLLSFIASVVFAVSCQAATIYIAPATSRVSVGNIVNVKVAVATQGKSINNAEVVISFPADLLEVLSISKNSSVFSLWVEEPKFSNLNGQITFNGGVPNPGYTGEGGEIASITFRAKKSGTATIVFADAAVRANDGLGTDVLASKSSGSITIESAATLEVPPVNTSSNNVPAKPIITSSTHPQQDSWYSNSNASFSWVMPDDITSIQTLLGKSPNSIPTVTYDSSVSQRTVNNLTDGILYFHLRYQNSVGWSPVAHYKIQVDTTPPEKFSLNVQNSGSMNTVVLNAFDALSGIDSYSVRIDAGSAIMVKKDMLADGGVYTLPVQDQGNHALVVVAYDKAGNHTEATTNYTSSSIVAPVIEVSPDYIVKGETAIVSGTSAYPRSQGIVSVELADGEIKEYPMTTDASGSFTVTTAEFKSSGSSSAWAQLIFSDTVRSTLSNKVFFEVNDTPFVRTSKVIAYDLAFLILLILLLLILAYISYLGWHKFFGLRRRIHREVDATIVDVHKAMISFRDELSKQCETLEKIKEDRVLNKKEEKIFKELQNNIDRIDDFIEKKLKKIR